MEKLFHDRFEENEILRRDCFFSPILARPIELITNRGLISTKRKNVRDVLFDNRKHFRSFQQAQRFFPNIFPISSKTVRRFQALPKGDL